MLISIEPHVTCDFSGAGPDPLSPYGSAHAISLLIFLSQKKTLAVASQKIPLKKAIHFSTKTNVWTYR